VISHPDYRITRPVVRRRFRPGKRIRGVVGIILMLFGTFLFWQQVVTPWMQDQWNDDSSRVTQLNANVGHGDEEHFIAEYEELSQPRSSSGKRLHSWQMNH
jgi:hypothetical protein